MGSGLRRWTCATEEAGLPLLLQSVTLTRDHDGLAAVQETIEERCREDFVSEHRAPLRDELIGRDERARLLVAPCNEREEEMGAASLERQVPEFVDQEQFRLRVEAQPFFEIAFGFRAGERSQQRRRACEQRRGPGLDEGSPDPNREMRLTDARWSEDQHILRLRDETSGGELADKLCVDRGLELEVELLEGLDRGEMGDLDAHLNALASLGLKLIGQHLVDEIEVRRLGARRLGEHGVEALHDVEQMQLLEAFEHARVDDVTAHGAASLLMATA